jgi:hypothetical protein
MNAQIKVPGTPRGERTERVSAYVEYDVFNVIDDYRERMGLSSNSDALRRLAIVGAMAEGYTFDEKTKKWMQP